MDIKGLHDNKKLIKYKLTLKQNSYPTQQLVQKVFFFGHLSNIIKSTLHGIRDDKTHCTNLQMFPLKPYKCSSNCNIIGEVSSSRARACSEKLTNGN